MHTVVRVPARLSSLPAVAEPSKVSPSAVAASRRSSILRKSAADLSAPTQRSSASMELMLVLVLVLVLFC